MSPLHLLFEKGNPELLSFNETFHVFIERNADLNIQNNFKQTLLHLVIANSNPTAVSMLLEQPDIDIDVSQIKIKSFF